MFLSQEELFALTGYRIPKCQIRVLRENGIKYIIGGDYKPRVLISAVENILGQQSKSTKKTTPDFAALEKAMGL